MKTLMLRVCYWGLAVSAILIAPGANKQANADVPDPVADVLKPLQLPDIDADVDEDVPAPVAIGAAGGPNAPVKAPTVVSEPTTPPNMKLSPPMAEVIKLVQAGVSQDVLLAYVTNSTSVFNVDSDTIVYLNDLGVTNSVITALIQHDASPETAARRASANAVQPLPPGVATTAPVTDVYPPAATRSVPAPGQTIYPGEYGTVTDTNLPPAVEAAAPVEENANVNYFYNSLSPYGSWVDVAGYGLCWRPTVAVVDPYWRPYCQSGRWMWSDCGWYWYSDYSWGWAPFHYGRWCSYPRVGWVWVPGSVWGPSWVTWRYTDGYCGWAPLPPGCGYRSGIGLTWYGHGVGVGFDFGLGWSSFAYVPIGHFCDWHVSRHCLPEHRVHGIHATTVAVNRVGVRNNTIVNNGIEPNTIARATRTKIPTMHVKTAALPVNQTGRAERLETSGNSVAVVRPQLPKNPPAVTPAVSRGTATHATPLTLDNRAQAAATARLNTSGGSNPRATGNATPPASNLRNPVGRESVEPRNVATASPNSGGRMETATRPQTTTPRQGAPPTLRNEPTAPAVRNATPPARNLAPPQSQAPVTRPAPQAAPPARSVAPQQNQPVAPRSAAPPSSRYVSPMIRSYAEPQQRYVPNAGVAMPPAARLQNPAAMQPSVHPQVISPHAEMARPSMPAAPQVHSAPSVSHSAPSSGSSGNGGGRSSGLGRQ